MKKTINLSKKYLLFPVRVGEEIRNIGFYNGEKKFFEIFLPVGNEAGAYKFQYYGALNVEEWESRQVTIQGDVSEAFFSAVAVSDSVPHSMSTRPVIHFAPESGWMNDPNGLFFQNGIYHLYFQHNPFDIKWGNTSWGHAVSTDLLHWEQKDTVLLPDENGFMFSGSAIVNEQEKLGIRKEAVIFFYTSAGRKSFEQRIAYSEDYGNSFVKRKECVLPQIAELNRDPKVYWDDKRKRYYMVLYLKENLFGIFISENLEKWELTQELTLPYACECPDLREVPVEGGGTKWLFWSADGYYCTGEFDGLAFKPEGGMHEAYQSPLPYAAQTYWGTERVITIPWLRTNNRGKLFTGIMGIPRQLTLVKKDDGYFLRQRIVDEIAKYKEKIFEEDVFCPGKETAEERKKQIEYIQTQETAVEISLVLGEGTDFWLNIYGTDCVYERNTGILKISGTAQDSESVLTALGKRKCREAAGDGMQYRFLEVGNNLKEVSFLSDGEIMEVTAEDGLICGIYETLADKKSGKICVTANGKMRVEIARII